MKKIAPAAAGSACPSYDDLIWFADTGDRERLKGHDPTVCTGCSRHLEEYQSLLRELTEPYADSQ